MSDSNRKITALYCRLSQEDMRDDESVSNENQKLILQKYANDHGFLLTTDIPEQVLIVRHSRK